MNKNVVGIVLIVLALALVGLYGYPKMKPYLFPPVVEGGAQQNMMEATGGQPGAPAGQPGAAPAAATPSI